MNKLKNEIIGMAITSKILFDKKFNHNELNNIMNQIEDEFTKVIENHPELISSGGVGVFIRDSDEYEIREITKNVVE